MNNRKVSVPADVVRTRALTLQNNIAKQHSLYEKAQYRFARTVLIFKRNHLLQPTKTNRKGKYSQTGLGSGPSTQKWVQAAGRQQGGRAVCVGHAGTHFWLPVITVDMFLTQKHISTK